MLQVAYRLALLAPLSMVGCSTLPAVSPATSGPDVYQPTLAAVVGKFLQEYHYTHPKFDDTMSEQWLKDYIDSLDYSHMVFLQSDVDEFNLKFAHRLDDDLKLKAPRVDAAFEIFHRYQQRLGERTADALALLDQPVDFTLDEKYAYDRKDAPFPKTAAEAKELWRLQVKSDRLLGALAKKPDAEQIDMLKKRYQRRLKDANEFDGADVMELYLDALCEDLDPHTTWFKPATNEDFDIDMSNSVEGIGATLQTKDEYTVVVALVPGGPAERSGLIHEKDKIVAVAQDGQPPVDVVDLRIDKVVKLIRGPKGTKVTLTVLPIGAADGAPPKQIELVRDKVEITTQEATSQEIDVPAADGASLRVGVVDVPSFYLDSAAKDSGVKDYTSTTRDVRKLIGQLKEKGIDALVIDLRDDGGGALSEAVDLTGLFIDTGPVVEIKDSRGSVESMGDEDSGVAWGGPLVVLTNEGSASASEIFAGAIQDYGRGLIVGSEQTHGKGTVQTVMDLEAPLRTLVTGLPPDEPIAGALKLTTHKFYRVSGDSTQEKGVAADVRVPSPYEGLDISEKSLPHALPFDRLSEGAPHATLGHPHDLAAPLQAASQARVTGNKWFGWMAEDIARRTAQDKDKTVSLNLAVRQKERDEAKARLAARGLPDNDDDSAETPPKKAPAPAVIACTAYPCQALIDLDPDHPEAGFVLDEAVQVTRDYVAALGKTN